MQKVTVNIFVNIPLADSLTAHAHLQAHTLTSTHSHKHTDTPS